MPDSRLFPWIIRHASMIATYYHLRVNGQTSFRMLRGRDAAFQLAQFGEVVMWKVQDVDHPRSKILPRWNRGIYAGFLEPSGQSAILTEGGVEVTKSISRLPLDDQWDAKLLGRVSGVPWSKKDGVLDGAKGEIQASKIFAQPPPVVPEAVEAAKADSSKDDTGSSSVRTGGGETSTVVAVPDSRQEVPETPVDLQMGCSPVYASSLE